MPTQTEIDDVLNQCAELENQGITNTPGMTYEQGVKAGIEWVTSSIAPNPLED